MDSLIPATCFAVSMRREDRIVQHFANATRRPDLARRAITFGSRVPSGPGQRNPNFPQGPTGRHNFGPQIPARHGGKSLRPRRFPSAPATGRIITSTSPGETAAATPDCRSFTSRSAKRPDGRITGNRFRQVQSAPRRRANLAAYSRCVYLSSFINNIEKCPKIRYRIGQIPPHNSALGHYTEPLHVTCTC